ncbi:MAG TPA: class I SAM-dependent methyltransferase [Pyrinomonadaceae bacterium]|nr:class I SAM-dependent methyltransferase [Pyrinomonadaceae bacterium]
MQKTIAMMPLADQIYYAMQRTVGSLRPGRSNPLEWFDAALSIVTWLKGAGASVEGRRFLEVGTGHYPNVPVGLWLCGAGEVVTVDLNAYLTDALASQTAEFVRQNREAVAAAFGAEAEVPLFRERLNQLAGLRAGAGARELLELARIKYLAPADATKLEFPGGSFDFHVSHAVFEHIPAETISAILAEARRLLKPEGLLMHIIDPSDHFSHDDPSITAVNFLQFSEREWERWAGNKFMYHNRLRAFEYGELFERAGVRVLRQSEAVDEPSLLALRNGFRLDEKFRRMGVEELAVRGLIVVGKFERSHG